MTTGKASELELQRITSAWVVVRPLMLTITELIGPSIAPLMAADHTVTMAVWLGNLETRQSDCLELQLMHADVALEKLKRLPLGDVTLERHSVAHFQTRVSERAC
jgi:hypothetical protein